MDLLSLLGGIFGGQQTQSQPQNRRRVMFEDGSVGNAYPDQVYQQPQKQNVMQSRNPNITGAVNPLFRQHVTGQASIYSPGELQNFFNR